VIVHMQSGQKREFLVYLVVGVLTLILVTASIEAQQHTALAEPKFPNTDKGNQCREAWKTIKDLREKSDRNNGVLSKTEQFFLDLNVKFYNQECRDLYGGAPLLSGQTGIVHNPSGGIVEPGPKTPKNPDVGSNTGTVEPGPKNPKNKEANIPKSGGGFNEKNNNNPQITQ
jgi:hypothetical protein